MLFEKHNKHCKAIVDELRLYSRGEIYRCPECGAEFDLYDMYGKNHYFDENDNEIGKCPECGYTSENHCEFEQCSLFDYFVDCLDIQYLIGSDRETLHGVRILVAYGGPNIWINTISGKVELYWWNELGEWPIDRETIQEIDDLFAELWGC